MGNIKYAIRVHKNRETGELKAYGYVVSDPYSLDDLTRDVTEETTVTSTDVKAVIEAVFKTCIRRIADGLTVKLGDFGSVYPTIASEGVEDVNDFSASKITKVRVRFRPGTKLLREVSKSTFESTISRKAERAAKKAEKEANQDKIDGNGGGDGDGGGGNG